MQDYVSYNEQVKSYSGDMGTRNALEIMKKRMEEDPELQLAYIEEKRKDYIARKIREQGKMKEKTFISTDNIFADLA